MRVTSSRGAGTSVSAAVYCPPAAATAACPPRTRSTRRPAGRSLCRGGKEGRMPLVRQGCPSCCMPSVCRCAVGKCGACPPTALPCCTCPGPPHCQQLGAQQEIQAAQRVPAARAARRLVHLHWPLQPLPRLLQLVFDHARQQAVGACEGGQSKCRLDEPPARFGGVGVQLLRVCAVEAGVQCAGRQCACRVTQWFCPHATNHCWHSQPASKGGVGSPARQLGVSPTCLRDVQRGADVKEGRPAEPQLLMQPKELVGCGRAKQGGK